MYVYVSSRIRLRPELAALRSLYHASASVFQDPFGETLAHGVSVK